MASIEYGIGINGKKVFADEAFSGRTYICPYCNEEINVRKCCDRDDYFAHKSIYNRTPQQRMCPGYTGEGKIEDKVDSIYITNGGVPLYLYEYVKGQYQLNACFPPLSQKSQDLLEELDFKIGIIENGKTEEYYAADLGYYKLKSNAEWIEIQCKNTKIPELQRKWGWGIRGLNCEKDIFHYNYGGGYRVSLHSNIVVGKEYLIVVRFGRIPKVLGITYFQKGNLRFNSLYSINKYDVYSMVVEEVTEEAIAYIQKKGYQLIEKSDEIIPMWPPAVIEGKELIYQKRDTKAFLYHSKRSEQELSSISGYGLRGVPEYDNIFETGTDNNSILLSDRKFNKLSGEIRFILTQNRDNFDNEGIFEPRISWKDDNSIANQLFDNKIDLLSKKKVYIDSDVDFVACTIDGIYIKRSTKRVLEDLDRSRKIVISMEPFGIMIITNERQADKNNISFTIELFIEELYRCNSAKVPLNKDFYEVYKFAVNNSEELLRVLENWAVTKQMPYAAAGYLYRIKEAIKNE